MDSRENTEYGAVVSCPRLCYDCQHGGYCWLSELCDNNETQTGMYKTTITEGSENRKCARTSTKAPESFVSLCNLIRKQVVTYDEAWSIMLDIADAARDYTAATEYEDGEVVGEYTVSCTACDNDCEITVW